MSGWKMSHWLCQLCHWYSSVVLGFVSFVSGSWFRKQFVTQSYSINTIATNLRTMLFWILLDKIEYLCWRVNRRCAAFGCKTTGLFFSSRIFCTKFFPNFVILHLQMSSAVLLFKPSPRPRHWTCAGQKLGPNGFSIVQGGSSCSEGTDLNSTCEYVSEHLIEDIRGKSYLLSVLRRHVSNKT